MIELLLAMILAAPAPAETDLGDLVPPKAIKKVPPEWPYDWSARVPPGGVTMFVTVGTDGTVKDVQVIQKDHERYVEPCVDAMRRWRFEPATRGGVPIEMGYTVKMRVESDIAPKEMPPQLVERVEPEYPAALVDQKLDGEVELEIRIDETGAVVGARILRSDHPEFSKAAVAAIRKWRYDPAVLDGKLAKSTAEVKMKFRWKKAAKNREDR